MAGNRNSGRRPKPTALKVLRGNPGQRPLNDAEPIAPEGVVVAPESLSVAARAVWGELAPACIAMRTLTPADVTAFAALCELEVTRRAASSQKDAEGFTPFLVSEDYNGADKLQVHPALKLERETANALRPYFEKFGMEPSGRARIKVPKVEKPESKWAGLIS
jgi:P27 family predicted phage terminase small subunit